MTTRRHFLTGAAALAAAPALPACSAEDVFAYEEQAARLRAILSAAPDIADFIRYATLAANGHNAQPWIFALRDGGLTIRADPTRRTPAVDPDDHHLHVSLGCAAENLRLAAQAHGRPAIIAFAGEGVEIAFDRGAPEASDLCDAIPHRQSTRSVYDQRGVPAGDLRALEAAAAVEGVSLMLVTERSAIGVLRDLVVAGNGVQMDDSAFRAELRSFIRFNAAEALARGDGLFTACTGNPSLPGWLGRRIFPLVFTKGAENDRYAEQMDSSAGVAVFVGERADADHWVRVGRSFERFALKATALGIRHAHVNQPVEVSAIRRDLAGWLGAPEARPDLVVRFGYAAPLPMSMRRPVEAVIA